MAMNDILFEVVKFYSQAVNDTYHSFYNLLHNPEGLAIFLAGITLIASELLNYYRHQKNQKQILKNLLVEIYFLTKKQTSSEDGKNHGGHIFYFKDCFKNDKVPLHNILELNNLNHLDSQIAWEKTSSIKHLIFHANDKIKLLNFYRDYLLRLGDCNLQKKFVLDIINELEILLRRINYSISSKFKIFLNREEIQEINQSTFQKVKR